MKPIDGQVCFDDLPCMERPVSGWGCEGCICRSCLYHWSGRCPHGGCYDDLRAVELPYDREHPGEIRDGWSRWNEPGEQAHWCRGGITYPAQHCEHCEHYVHYEGQKVKECLKANVSVFQDGYISCSLIEHFGCERCMEEYERKLEIEEDHDGN